MTKYARKEEINLEKKLGKRLKICLVGCGYIAKDVHLPLLTNSKDFVVAAVCDVDKKKAIKVAKDFHIPKVYSEFSTLLEEEEIDLIDICAPPAIHFSLLREAFNKGYPCMVEKPLTTSSKDAQEIIKLSKVKGLGLYVLHNYSYLPCIRKVRKILNEHRIGKILIIENRYFAPIAKERYGTSEHWIHKLPGGILSSEITPHLLMLNVEFIGKVIDTSIITKKISGSLISRLMN